MSKSKDPDYVPPKKQSKQTRTANNCCIICNGAEGLLSEQEAKRNITEKGLSSLLRSCRDKGDEVGVRILALNETSLQSIKFHNKCRVKYVHHCEQQSSKSSSSAPASKKPSTSSAFLRSLTSPFNFKTQCFACGNEGDGSYGDALTKSTKKTTKIWSDILTAAYQRDDECVIQRLEMNSPYKPAVLLLHRTSCYSLYINPRNIKSAKNKAKSKDTNTIYEQVTATLVAELSDRLFVNKEIISLPEARQRYVDLLIAAGNKSPEQAERTRSFTVKSKLLDALGNKIVFYHQNGNPDLLCSDDTTIGCLKGHINALDLEGIIIQSPNSMSDDLTIYNAAGILRRDISQLPPTKEYPNSNEMSVDDSEVQLPKRLTRFVQLILDQEAAASDESSFTSSEAVRRRYVAICESIVYCSRRGHSSQVLPPLHFGLMLQLHHQYGSRNLIDTLHSHGFCATYDELRLFLSAAARQEIENMKNGVVVPYGMVPKKEDDDTVGFIHEGDDNVDIQTKTPGGQDTYHAMARVVFQDQHKTTSKSEAPRIKRPKNPSNQRTLVVDDMTERCLTKPLGYMKPNTRPEPPRCTAALVKMKAYTRKTADFSVRDLSWVLLRQITRSYLPVAGFCKPRSQCIPFWTGFNSMLENNQNIVTMASYAPTIEAPPTDMATVYTVLKRGKDIVKELGQTHQVHTFDQQLYVIAQQVKWSLPLEFQHLTIRLGGFHGMCSFIACIGKLWSDGGIRDILADSGVYAPCTVDRMMSGHQFHRAVRGLTLCYELLMGRFIDALMKWLGGSERKAGASNSNELDRIWNILSQAEESIEKKSNVAEHIKLLDEVNEEVILPIIDKFTKWGSEISPTFQYWIQCLHALQIMLDNIRAERVGDWRLHLETVTAMIPYYFICNRQNYARWASVYLVDMIARLPPDVQEAFQAGQFSVKRSRGKFNGIWSDMGVESTVIKDSKSKSGIIGLTRRGTSVLRWSLTRQLLGQYTSALQERSCSSSCDGDTHEQEKTAMMLQDEQHAQQLRYHLENNMTDPFDTTHHPEVLLNIGSGLHTTASIQKSLLNASETGRKAFEVFITERLSEDGTKSLYDPIPRSRLTTFIDMNKVTKVTVAAQKIKAALSAEAIFRRALTISSTRPEISLTTLMSRPITSVPTSLFKEDGSKMKTNKADLTHWLEDKVSVLPTLPVSDIQKTVYLLDGMADVQAVNGDKFRLFQDIGQYFLEAAVSLLKVADEVHVVYDRYDEKNSIKADERALRLVRNQSNKTYSIVPGRPIPPWRKFLSVIENKESFAEFLCNFQTDSGADCLSELALDRKLFISGGFADRRTAKCVTATGVRDCEFLRASHEEADTRIIFHLVDADRRMAEEGYQNGRAVIKTPDTDVICLAVHFFDRMVSINELWIQTGSVGKAVDRVRFIPIHDICAAIGHVICRILPAVHAITGCDSVSSLFSIGKKTVMKTVSDGNGEEFKDLSCMGMLNDEAENDVVNAARKLVMQLYDPKKKHRKLNVNDLNALRVRLAMKKDQSLARLPPCEASFLQHVKRASWQTQIWMRAHQGERDPGTMSPIGHGWSQDSGRLVPVLFEGESAAEMLDDLVCSCSKRSKCGSNCSCSLNGLPCIELCICNADECCKNILTHKIVDDSESVEEQA